MRIAVLSTLASGGAGTAAWRISRAFSNFGHDCSFFALGASGNPLHIPLVENGGPLWLSAFFRRWSDLADRDALTANTVELFSDAATVVDSIFSVPEGIRNADIIHLHWVAGILFSPALLSAMSGKRVVWTLHDENAFTGGCHYSGDCKAFETQCHDCRILKEPGRDDVSARCFALKKRIYPSLNPFLVTPSAWLAEKAGNSALLGGCPVTTIPNPLDMDCFQPPRNRSALREKLGLPEDGFVILSGCENLENPRKNARALFDGLNLLSREHPSLPVTVMLYGHGQPPELSFPTRHFGYIDNEADIVELYGAADLFIHTSLQDNLSMALCEAQACGTPTLCFDVGGCHETMLSGETGFLAPETNAKALAEKLREIIENRDNLGGMRKAARVFAEKRFNPHAIAAAYTEVFHKALISPGLQTDEPLFAELMQNQVASFASFFYDACKGHDALSQQYDLLRQEHDALSQQQRRQHDVLRQEHDALRQQHDALRQQHDVLRQQHDVVNQQHDALRQQSDVLRQEHDALRQEFETLRWKQRHPFKRVFRRLRAKLCKSECSSQVQSASGNCTFLISAIGQKNLSHPQEITIVSMEQLDAMLTFLPRAIAELDNFIEKNQIHCDINRRGDDIGKLTVTGQWRGACSLLRCKFAVKKMLDKYRLKYKQMVLKKKRWPKISIVLPSFNQAAFVRQALDSIFAQKYPNLETIVLDPGSTDGTREILAEYKDKINMLILEPDKGQSDALERGLNLAQGEILTWLCTDDMLEPDSLFHVAEAFMLHKTDVVIGGCRRIDEAGEELSRHYADMPFNEPVPMDAMGMMDVLHGWQAGRFYFQPEVFFTRDIWRRAGAFFHQTAFYCMDYDLWVRMALAGGRGVQISHYVAASREQKNQKTDFGQSSFLWQHANFLRHYNTILTIAKKMPGYIFE